MRLFIFGAGYSARAIARDLAGESTWTGGTTRNTDKAGLLRDSGIEPFLFDGKGRTGDIDAALSDVTHLLVSIAPGEDGDPVLTHYADIIRPSKKLSWIGYLSTVGVYGNHDGAWVDETTPCKPVSKRSVWRDKAEQAWLALGAEADIPTGIFRLSGIYGPGRNGLEKLKAGTARRIDKPGQVFNRIHVDDIGQTVARAAVLKASGLFNVTDDEPTAPEAVVAHGAHLLGLDPPPLIPFEDADLSPMGRSFYGENKRVSNARIKDVLGVTLRFPTYREGLGDLVNQIR